MRNRSTLFFFIGFLLMLASCGTSKSMHHQPEISNYNATKPIVTKLSDSIFVSGKNSLLKNKQGIWELYVEGDPLEIGLNSGALSDSLLKNQEHIFFSKIQDIIPSKFEQKMLRHFLKWYNRKLYLNVPEEYQTEIYGVSQYTSHDFDNIAPQYQRSLYLHAAHDIGHALQDLALVGCSSFAAWGEKSEDGNLILGRNFDFYVNDAFAENKIIAFVNPEVGNQFMMVTWPGMIGAVSGMNIQGLTVTINAGKSKIPMSAKTPISILTREILQHASTIDEAIAIAKKRKVFVSESIMVGSAKDNKAILIEVTPKKMDIYDVPNSDQLICSNHFQSDAFKDEERNLSQIANSHSKYRFDRMQELFAENPKINPKIASEILRNKEGLQNIALGYGNEKALNQLMAHHGIIFKPKEKLVWVSANPYQLGEFVCYNLDSIFKDRKTNTAISFEQENLNIAKDPFLETTKYKNYQNFRIEDHKIDLYLKNKTAVSAEFIQNYQSLNPDYWVVYYKTGLYFYQKKDFIKSQDYFEKALTKEITTAPEKAQIEKYLKKIKRKLQ
ncbi:acyl-CoA--6-aminopenicillanic acid acyl-transferase [Flavobacterium hibernum]|uniref:Acyl-CoA--6-aminopenicillanic acid acyl-transferase n=1 Tax=Flavobacterium hibernum TaxID=37752 RepID=A0A0D0EDT2_9FLAO|nr:acyl-CoA--6-aminopenicillanic acid acyl-transferase [Flavobacterium hibernum]KIO51149.1 acyl-CoA:6-aminopenicillanic acid acyl-transferase [Flavobacterium hibernum]OXA86213.1 acyl-CoA--6-aminopenicillanic acid acyl-transferase [Flavobacterium hibernum]STO14536.1 Predicted choloylglycine hydrolase [Flavobacterium hibernum]